MAFLDELKAVFSVIINTIHDIFAGDSAFSKRVLRQIFIALLVLIAGASAYMGHRWYVVSREQAAHYAFADYMADYQAALKADNSQEWQRVDSLLEYGYNQHKNSTLAPLFLALRADIQVKQHNISSAVDMFAQVVQELPKDSPIAPLFKIKRALLLLDSADEALQKMGLDELLQVARDKENRYNDMALFYLGRYYWATNAIDEAKKVWQELVDDNAMNQAYPSPWAQEANRLVKQLA